MNPQWLIGSKTDTETARRSDLVKNSRQLLELLQTVAEQQIIELSSSSFDDYDHPSWSHREADRKGQIRAWKKLLTLCNQPKETHA